MRKACWAGKWHRPPGKQPVGVEYGHRMAALVERMLVLHKQLADAKNPTSKELLQRQTSS